MKTVTREAIAFLSFFIIFTCAICEAKWFDDDTRYRLEVTPEKSGEILFVDIEDKIFPADFKNGVSIFSINGEPAPFFFSKDRNRLFISSNKEDSLLHIYFGFDKKHSLKKWDDNLKKITQDERLKLKLLKLKISNKNNYLNTDEGLLDLCNNTFDVEDSVLRLQKLMKRMSDLRSQKRKIEKELAKTKDKKKIDVKNKRKGNLEKTIIKLKSEFSEAEKKLSQIDRDAKHYKRLWTTPISTKPATEILIKGKKFGKIKKYEFAGAKFKGNLFIKEEGDYDFAINSVDASLLKIDDKLLISWPKNHSTSKTWTKTARIHLKPGLHKLCFYYFKQGDGAVAEAAWKKAEEKEFRALEESDFAPAYPTQISCVDKGNHLFPVVNYERNGYFLLEDGIKADWINCWVDEDNEDSDFLWMSDGTVVSKSNSSSFLQIRDTDRNLLLSSKSGKFNDIPINLSHKNLHSKRFDPDIELKIWTPSFIYDTEFLDMDIEMVSGLPIKNNILLKTSVSRTNSFLKDETRFISLKGRKQFETARFSPPSRLKENIEIMGPELKDGLDITFYLMIPPIIFSKHSVRFIPISQCTDIIETVDGLVDEKGQRVIPVLHRPDLAEKRVWSLSKNIVNELSSTKKLLLIADNFGNIPNSFRDCLKKRLASKKIELEFLPWNAPELGSSIRGSIGTMVSDIQKSTADRILIIPPVRDINTGIPVRTQTRALAALVQVAEANKNIRVIYVSSPFPSLRRTKLDNELSKSILQMSIEYNIEFFDMKDFISNKPNWRYSYRFNEENDLLYEPYPVHLKEEISQKILDSL